jgi:hypothetical protein
VLNLCPCSLVYASIKWPNVLKWNYPTVKDVLSGTYRTISGTSRVTESTYKPRARSWELREHLGSIGNIGNMGGRGRVGRERGAGALCLSSETRVLWGCRQGRQVGGWGWCGDGGGEDRAGRASVLEEEGISASGACVPG